jgi:hypothetical protein
LLNIHQKEENLKIQNFEKTDPILA